jgi:hypothetical protein
MRNAFHRLADRAQDVAHRYSSLPGVVIAVSSINGGCDTVRSRGQRYYYPLS